MKRLLALLCVLALAGCSTPGGGHGSSSADSLMENPIAEAEGGSASDGSEVSDVWGVNLTVKDVTPTGLTIVCTQSGGENVAELNTGSFFVLEQERDGQWEECEVVVVGDYAFTAEAWMIPMADSVEWEIDWEWLYGELSPGTYRIGKEIMNFRGTGDFDETIYYAEFII